MNSIEDEVKIQKINSEMQKEIEKRNSQDQKNLVQIYDSFIHQGRLFVILEYFDNGNLKNLIKMVKNQG